MPCCSISLATCSSSSGVRGCSSPVSLCTKKAIGTPHWRWRDSVQSGRLAIMPCRRAWPQSGKNVVSSMPRQRGLAQRRAAVLRRDVHAGEPLGGGAVDDRRLVAPAVHVAVVEHLQLRTARRLRVSASQIGLDASQIVRPPNSGSGRRVAAVAHHRVQDLVVLHAVRLARHEVVDAVGGRRVDDAGAGVERHVVAQVDRRRAVVERVGGVQRMLEARCRSSAAPGAGGDDRAFEL